MNIKKMDKTVIISGFILFVTVNGFENEASVLVVNLTSSSIYRLRQNQIIQPVKEDRIKFLLYNRRYPDGYRLIRNNIRNLRNSNFNSSYKTKVIIHGYVNNYTSAAIQLPKNAYLSTGKFNIIAVDWSEYSFPYILAASSVKAVGHITGSLISFLINRAELRASDLHIIGHSLGAHVAGYVVEKIGVKPARITGLDPAAPIFSEYPSSQRLGAEDADFVDVIHTSVRVLGMSQNIGHVDFYPAGGKHQPRCPNDIVEEVIGIKNRCDFYVTVKNTNETVDTIVDTGNLIMKCSYTDFITKGSCDHGQSYIYFAESIQNKNQFPAIKCKSLSDALERRCWGRKTAIMGENATYRKPRGIYYVDVSSFERQSRLLDVFSVLRKPRLKPIFDFGIF